MAAVKARKRAPKGSIARHPERVRIERARLAGVSLDKIAERYRVGRDAIWRHVEKLDPAYKAALITDIPREELAQRVAEADGDLLDHFKLIRSVIEDQLLVAKVHGDSFAIANLGRAAIQANRELGKLSGELRGAAAAMTFNGPVAILNNPEFHGLEAGLIRIARRHPEARDDLLDLVRSLKRVSPAAPMIEGERAHA